MEQQNQDKYKNSGIYKFVCLACDTWYVGQTGRRLSARCNELIRYIRTNNPKLAYAMHVLNNGRDYGPVNTMDFLQSCE